MSIVQDQPRLELGWVSGVRAAVRGSLTFGFALDGWRQCATVQGDPQSPLPSFLGRQDEGSITFLFGCVFIYNSLRECSLWILPS